MTLRTNLRTVGKNVVRLDAYAKATGRALYPQDIFMDGTEVVAAFEHFAVGVVTVVFVAGHQSIGLAVFDHDVVAVGETA